MPTSSVTSSPLVGGEELGVCELVAQVSHPVGVPVVLGAHILRHLRPALAGAAHLLRRTRFLGLRWLDRPGRAFFRQISRNQLRQQVAIPNDPVMAIRRPVRAWIVIAQRPMMVVGDAMDASAVDFDMGEEATVLGRQGGFRGAGDGGHLVFRQPALHRVRSGLGADRPREHLPPIV